MKEVRAVRFSEEALETWERCLDFPHKPLGNFKQPIYMIALTFIVKTSPSCTGLKGVWVGGWGKHMEDRS